MKRVAMTLVVFTLIGAAMNVGVAWAGTRMTPVAVLRRGADSGLQDWPMHVPHDWPPKALRWPTCRRRLADVSIWHAGAGFDQWSEFKLLYYRFGLPFRSLTMGRLRQDEIREQPIDLTSGVFLGLPMVIRWPAFLANTAIYATAAYLITLAPFTARRVLRRRRGLCMRCGYDLRNIDGPCPECGTNR